MLLSLRLPLHRGDWLRPVRLLPQRLREMRHAVEGRRALAAMDARMLADIGISPGEAAEEISRRPWDTAPRPR